MNTTMPRATASQLVIAASRTRDLTDRTRDVLAEMGRLSERYDSARLASALGLLSQATGLLADAAGELQQAYVVAAAQEAALWSTPPDFTTPRCACGHRRDQHTPDGTQCGVATKSGGAPANAPYVDCDCAGYAAAR